MKIVIYIQLLLCLFGLGYPKKELHNFQLKNPIVLGTWKCERIQVQYVVDSHLVYEREVKAGKGKVYNFQNKNVKVKFIDGTTTAGTFSVVGESAEKMLELNFTGKPTTYSLISVTPTHMVWQKDLDDVNYIEGSTQKSAERAIYTEVFKKEMQSK